MYYPGKIPRRSKGSKDLLVKNLRSKPRKGGYPLDQLLGPPLEFLGCFSARSDSNGTAVSKPTE